MYLGLVVNKNKINNIISDILLHKKQYIISCTQFFFKTKTIKVWRFTKN